MDKNNHSSSPMGVHMEMNLMGSKLVPAILFKNELPFEEVEEVLHDLIAKIGTVNRLDLPLYISALKLLQATLSTELDETEEELVDLLMSHSTLTTYRSARKRQEGGGAIMELWEVMLCCGITAILVLGVVQLIDYERERKFREKRRRAALKRWFSQKMYNLETYGNLEGYVHSRFETEYPEYKSDYSRPRKEG